MSGFKHKRNDTALMGLDLDLNLSAGSIPSIDALNSSAHRMPIHRRQPSGAIVAGMPGPADASPTPAPIVAQAIAVGDPDAHSSSIGPHASAAARLSSPNSPVLGGSSSSISRSPMVSLPLTQPVQISHSAMSHSFHKSAVNVNQARSPPSGLGSRFALPGDHSNSSSNRSSINTNTTYGKVGSPALSSREGSDFDSDDDVSGYTSVEKSQQDPSRGSVSSQVSQLVHLSLSSMNNAKTDPLNPISHSNSSSITGLSDISSSSKARRSKTNIAAELDVDPYGSNNIKQRRKLRKNNREKQRRSELKDKLDELCEVLGFGPISGSGSGNMSSSVTVISTGTSSARGGMKIEKYTILQESINVIRALRKEVMELKVENMELRSKMSGGVGLGESGAGAAFAQHSRHTSASSQGIASVVQPNSHAYSTQPQQQSSLPQHALPIASPAYYSQSNGTAKVVLSGPPMQMPGSAPIKINVNQNANMSMQMQSSQPNQAVVASSVSAPSSSSASAPSRPGHTRVPSRRMPRSAAAAAASTATPAAFYPQPTPAPVLSAPLSMHHLHVPSGQYHQPLGSMMNPVMASPVAPPTAMYPAYYSSPDASMGQPMVKAEPGVVPFGAPRSRSNSNSNLHYGPGQAAGLSMGTINEGSLYQSSLHASSTPPYGAPSPVPIPAVPLHSSPAARGVHRQREQNTSVGSVASAFIPAHPAAMPQSAASSSSSSHSLIAPSPPHHRRAQNSFGSGALKPYSLDPLMNPSDFMQPMDSSENADMFFSNPAAGNSMLGGISNNAMDDSDFNQF